LTLHLQHRLAPWADKSHRATAGSFDSWQATLELVPARTQWGRSLGRFVAEWQAASEDTRGRTPGPTKCQSHHPPPLYDESPCRWQSSPRPERLRAAETKAPCAA